ncbi:HNH endonuclease [Rhodococcus sp. IEGM 1379]|uniref:HNH endonuclease n=1 Tax=Rhodococcus sp. IEGM 1379 TaxID=3047086 RepID=UPI0024B7F109|nr:HNH endonuclease [Rhodococcus sp. IEGM 1379]MDI9917646.1 HNH endonuclease [Rhodococcus sp. IEGM 1379]
MNDRWLKSFDNAGDGCAMCGTKTRILQSYCNNCKASVNQSLSQYRDAARNVLAGTGPLSQAWIELHNWLYGQRIPRKHALNTVKSEAINWLKNFADFARMDGFITTDELDKFRQAARILQVSPDVVAPLEARMLRDKMLGDIRQGQLPTVQIPGLHLPNDEYCYVVVQATRWRDLKAGPTPSHGQFAVTNRKIRFIAHQHGAEIPLGKVQRATFSDRSTITIEATASSLSGRFTVPDAEYASIVIDSALRIDRRMLLPGNADRPTRHIPPHVKAAVYQRDRGVCVQCGNGQYLEYDHIIPFSRGGANTEGNLQLLCRACNLAKGANI